MQQNTKFLHLGNNGASLLECAFTGDKNILINFDSVCQRKMVPFSVIEKEVICLVEEMVLFSVI